MANDDIVVCLGPIKTLHALSGSDKKLCFVFLPECFDSWRVWRQLSNLDEVL